MLLADLDILVVDGDPECLEVLGAHLLGYGARTTGVRSGASALDRAARRAPDVVICELSLPDFDGRSLVAALRGLPGCSNVPAIALTALPALAGYARALGAGFEKYLIKPARLGDVTDAVCCLMGDRRIPASGTTPTLGEISESISLHDYRSLLRALNRSTTHRYSSLLRFDDPELTSVWTFDRERPAIDPFPLRLRISETPCALIRSDRVPVTLDDTSGYGQSYAANREHGMRSLLGVPLLEEGGAAYGTLCHFDSEPRHSKPEALDLLERVARMFRFLSVKSRARG
jgi:CheY-like chemotaxis protein